MGERLQLLIAEPRLRARVAALARRIDADYAERYLNLRGIYRLIFDGRPEG